MTHARRSHDRRTDDAHEPRTRVGAPSRRADGAATADGRPEPGSRATRLDRSDENLTRGADPPYRASAATSGFRRRQRVTSTAGAVVEHVSRRALAAVRLAQRHAVHRPLDEGPATRFRRDPDRVSGATDWPADDPLTPAAHLLADGGTFEIEGDLYTVQDVHPSTRGAQADVLVVRGFEHSGGEVRQTLRAIQVRDLETLIDEGRVDITFLGCAKRFNLERGWCRGGRTLASLGITFDRDAVEPV